MRITADTNVLVRLVMADDEAQNAIAIEAIERATLVAISIHSFCELAWVLDRHYAVARPDIAKAIRDLVDAENVVVNRAAVDAGSRVLDAGGDFADGVIAHDAQRLGGETFVSFDKKAVSLIAKQGRKAELLA